MSDEMVNPIRVELVSRDDYWQKAVFVEWEHEYPERKPTAEGGRTYTIEAYWLADFERVAARCFTRVVHAPADSSRRQILRRIFALDAVRRY